MIPFCLGVPITAGKTDLGESSPAIPVLQRPEPVRIRELEEKSIRLSSLHETGQTTLKFVSRLLRTVVDDNGRLGSHIEGAL
jgi:hypothetical protein